MTYQELESMLDQSASGPRPLFTTVHVVRLLELVSNRYLGRKVLVKKLRVGEGSVRTVIKKLKEAGLIETKRAGTHLTARGTKILSSIRDQFTEGVYVDPGEATLDIHNVARCAWDASEAVNSGVEQRDAAMGVGSTGASTFVYRNGGLEFPGMASDLGQLDPHMENSIMEKLTVEDDDVVVVGSASDEETANLGSIAAAISLLRFM